MPTETWPAARQHSWPPTQHAVWGLTRIGCQRVRELLHQRRLLVVMLLLRMARQVGRKRQAAGVQPRQGRVGCWQPPGPHVLVQMEVEVGV